ncbi:acyl-CoA dehydrogenase family protein [Novosphingobium malaysiense]|uniref:Acyl-CoA dehydrogenase n=1 Tax=Novosphingobium malaysiense TaxID=1348853 RepID=A0A0B1ZL75_9SPHN|nr:acyl-CoA dehydrogenase family protein [Novosphingobium malaysiense]KHK91855.1 acyl-CoA dehydrogenase [Novosphingobium malaysiense]
MSILYDEGQQAMAEETRRVLAARTDRARQLELLDRCGEWDETFWTTAVDQGWTALAVPEAFGGLGLGLIELGLVAQEAGRVVSGAPFLTYGHGAVCALLASEDEGLQSTWLPRLAKGEVKAAVAFAEESSPMQPHPSVEFRGGKLQGAKSGVAGGLAADIVVVSASAAEGPVLVLVEAGDVLERRAIRSFDNSRLFADMIFDGSPARVLVSGDAADEAALDIQAQMAVLAAHEQAGGAEAAMQAARDYALERRAFGQPIGAFQSIKHRIAELYGLVEIARANCIHAAARQGRGDFLEAAACARLSAIEAYDMATRDAVQIHGGSGVTWDGGLHLHMRRARSLAIELGNALFWEDLLAIELTGVAA